MDVDDFNAGIHVIASYPKCTQDDIGNALVTKCK